MRYFSLIVLLLVVLSFLSLLPSLSSYHLHKEEVRRTLVAFEMDRGGNPFQPTLLGEPYYNKPPLFNWIIVAYSKLMGWGTLTPRSVTITFTLLTTLLTFLIALKILGDPRMGLVASLVFVTFSDVLFWYGWMAEIDITYSFITSLMIFLTILFFTERRPIYILGAGILCGVGFSLKGFPSFAFFGITLVTLSVFYRSYRTLVSPPAVLAYVTALLSSIWWVPLSEDPVTYMKTLWNETFSRVEASREVWDTLVHLITYPLLNLKQTLPASLFALFLLTRKVFPDPRTKVLLVTAGANYIPYLLSPEARGRYILPLLPLVAVVIASMLVKVEHRKVFKLFLLSVLVTLLLRFAYGLFLLPYLEERKGDPERVAVSINSLVKDKNLACGCSDLWDLCLYVGMTRGHPVYSPRANQSWEVLIDCERRDLPVLKEFRIGGRRVFLHTRVYNHSNEDVQGRETVHAGTGGDPRQGEGGPEQTDRTPQDP